MLKENIVERVESNKCPICGVEFTKETEVRNVFYKVFGKKVKICKKHSFYEEKDR